MLWKYWAVRDLQASLEALEPGLLDRLERIIPPLSDAETSSADLYRKKNLIRVFEAFAPGDCFKDKAFLRRCLDCLPPHVMSNFANSLGIGDAGQEFEENLKQILSREWKGGYASKFVEFFGLADHFLPAVAPRLPRHEDLVPASKTRPTQIDTPYKTLKDYQFQVLQDCQRELDIPLARLVIQMPTGSGKTRTAIEFITQYMNEAEQDDVVVWLVHSEELCEQAFQCFREIAAHVIRREVRACRVWGHHSFPAKCSKPLFIVGGFQKLHSIQKKKPKMLEDLRPRVGLVVVDEAHKATAKTYMEVVKAFRGPRTKVVGLSATPGRTDIAETEQLAELFFQSKVGIRVAKGVSVISMLRDRKVLSHVKYVPLLTRINYQLSAAEKRHLERHFDFPPGFLARLGDDEIRNVEIMRRLIKACDERRRILFFGCSVRHSRFIAALLLYFGYNAVHIDGRTDKGRRNAAIDGFRSGEVQVLCNYGILSTGFDAPSTDVVFVSRPTNSVVLYSQMIGRGLRGPAIGGTEECQLVDVRDNIVGFGDQERVYEYFEDYWN